MELINTDDISYMPTLKFKRLENGKDTPLPGYATAGSAGMDLHTVEAVKIYNGQTKILRTGLAVEVPLGYELQIRSRSGLAAKHGVFVTNGIGTIDSDYRGELMVILSHLGRNALDIEVGDRVAQIVLVPVTRGGVTEVEELSTTVRGVGGLGSTGR